jgi:hypothetical protein
MTHLLLITLLFFSQQAAAEKPSQEAAIAQPTSADKPLPWPGPDAHKSGKKLAQEQAYKLLNAKSMYIQSALPAEESTPPKWLTERWPVVRSGEADLHIFISKQSDQGKIDCSFTKLNDILNDPSCFEQPIPNFKSVAWYRVVVTDSEGNWVLNAAGRDSLVETWRNMYREIEDRERWSNKQAKKIAKDKKKASTQ